MQKKRKKDLLFAFCNLQWSRLVEFRCKLVWENVDNEMVEHQKLYSGPHSWPDVFEACSFGKQSPINIDTSSVRYSSSLTAFELTGYDSIPPNSAWSIENNGRTGTFSNNS